MFNQLIIRKTVTETITFLDKPQEATRKQLQAEGFSYDSRSKQWYQSTTDSAVQEEIVAATAAA